MNKLHGRSYVGEISTVATSILNLLNDNNYSADAFMTLQIEKLSNSNTLLTGAINEVVDKSELSAKDEERDDALRLLFLEAKSKLLWPDNEIAGAAHQLYTMLEQYGMETISKANNIESAYINALLQDCKKDHIKESIALLPDYASLIDNLEQKQKAFEAAYIKMVEKDAVNAKKTTAWRQKEIIRRQINTELLVYINAMSQAKPESFKSIADNINVLIENNNAAVRRRIKRNERENKQD